MTEAIGPALPHLGWLLRKLREDRKLSRERLGFATGISSSYINHLEAGNRSRPTTSVLTALERYLDALRPLTEGERRQLTEFSGGVFRPVPTVAQLRAEVSASAGPMLADFGDTLAACVDISWNVLACNDSYAAAFPGIVADGNILHWMFGSPEARTIMVEWRAEAELAVALLRGRLTKHTDLPSCRDLFAELSRNPDFQHCWAAGEVRFHRDRGPLLVRDPASGRPDAIQLQLFRFAAGVNADRVQMHLGIRTGEN